MGPFRARRSGQLLLLLRVNSCPGLWKPVWPRNAVQAPGLWRWGFHGSLIPRNLRHALATYPFAGGERPLMGTAEGALGSWPWTLALNLTQSFTWCFSAFHFCKSVDEKWCHALLCFLHSSGYHWDWASKKTVKRCLLCIIYSFLAELDFHSCAWAFSSCGEQGLLSSCSAWVSRGGFSCCRAWALGHGGSVAAAHGLSSRGAWGLEHKLRGCGTQA